MQAVRWRRIVACTAQQGDIRATCSSDASMMSLHVHCLCCIMVRLSIDPEVVYVGKEAFSAHEMVEASDLTYVLCLQQEASLKIQPPPLPDRPPWQPAEVRPIRGIRELSRLHGPAVCVPIMVL